MVPWWALETRRTSFTNDYYTEERRRHKADLEETLKPTKDNYY
jgi:hypothetical protein